MPECRHGDGPAVVRYRTPRGCVCFPEDREQDLCPQHLIKFGVNPHPKVAIIADYTLDQVFTRTRKADSSNVPQ